MKGSTSLRLAVISQTAKTATRISILVANMEYFLIFTFLRYSALSLDSAGSCLSDMNIQLLPNGVEISREFLSFTACQGCAFLQVELYIVDCRDSSRSFRKYNDPVGHADAFRNIVGN